MLEFVERVVKELDSGEPIDVIYMNLQKAFDKVPHRRLIARVDEKEIKGKLLNGLRNGSKVENKKW